MNDLLKYADVFREIKPWSGVVPAGFTMDFLGIRMRKSFREPWGHDPRFVDGEYLELSRPTLEDLDFWFEAADWILAAREARERFVMVTLGALHGYQAVGSFRTLQVLNPLPCKLVAVEPIPENMDRVRLHMRDNGIDPDEHWLLQTVISDRNEPAFFPIGSPGLGAQNCIATNEPAARQGYFDLFTDQGQVKEALANILLRNTTGLKRELIPGQPFIGEIKPVSSITLRDILSPFDRVDLIESDIQESEILVFPPFMDLLKKKARRIHIATHGASVHERLVRLFKDEGWEIVFCYEPDSQFETPIGALRTNDGVLSVRNPGL
jgi:hypothetical protein